MHAGNVFGGLRTKMKGVRLNSNPTNRLFGSSASIFDAPDFGPHRRPSLSSTLPGLPRSAMKYVPSSVGTNHESCCNASRHAAAHLERKVQALDSKLEYVMERLDYVAKQLLSRNNRRYSDESLSSDND
jgi:hypothetical protein